MGRRSLTLLILALVAFGGLAWLLSRDRGTQGSAAPNLPDTPTLHAAPDREILVAAPEIVAPEPEREAQAAEPEPDEERLSGRITDEQGRGIYSARIQLYDARRARARGFGGQTKSDSGGRYGMDHKLRSGSPMGLLVSAEGFLPRLVGPLAVTDDPQRIDVVLGAGEGLAGTVRWEDGRPAGGASVEVRGRTKDTQDAQAMEGWRAEIQSVLGQVAADEAGRFVLRGSAAGPLSIRAEAEREGQLGYGFLDDVFVGGPELELVLRAGNELALEVVDDIGEPVEKVILSMRYGAPGRIGNHPDDLVKALGAGKPRYDLTGLRSGNWSVQVRSGSYRPATKGDDQAHISLPRDAAPLRFTLLRPGSISGRVLDSVGRPLVGTQVKFIAGATDERTGATSDEDGNFRVVSAMAGPGVLSTEAGALQASIPVDVWPGQETRNVELRLSAGGTVRLQVVDTRGQPLAKRLTFLLAGTENVQNQETDESGIALLGPVAPGQYTVVAVILPTEEIKGDGVKMLENLRSVVVEVLDGQEVQITLGPATRPGVELSGRVTLAGEPVKDAQFMLFREGVDLVQAIRSLSTDEHGVYRVKLDAPGTFLMLMQESRTPWAVARIEVPDVPQFVLDLELPEGRIAGRLLGTEHDRFLVTLEREDDSLDISFPDFRSGTTTDEDGSFAFDLLLPGTFTLRVNGNQSRSWRPLTGLRLEPGQALTDIELLPATSGTVSGEVRGPGAAPGTAALVYLRAEDGTVLHLEGTPTNEQGRFRVEGVPSGRWTASAHAAGLASASRVLDTRGGDVHEVVLSLAAGALLEVRLLDAAGHLSGATLKALDSSGLDVSQLREPALREPGYTAVLDPSLYRFGPLPPGRYRLVAVAPDGRRAERTVRIEGAGQVAVELVLK